MRPALDESKKLKKLGLEAVAADILRGWIIVRPERINQRLKWIRSEAGG